MSNTILIFTPTYNERENVEKLCGQLLALNMPADILFCDDNSPDGTGEILDRLAREHANIKVLHRSGKLGVGSAHQAGIRYAYEHGYEWLITMDADFSHTPADILRFWEHRNDFDVVVGSRYMNKRSLAEWNLFRRTLTLTGHLLTGFFLKMPYDATGALRLYKLRKIPLEVFDRVESKGYSFFFESLYALYINGFKIKEVSIVLPGRTYGHSKMSFWEPFKSLKRLCSIYSSIVLRKDRYRLPFKALNKGAGSEWDGYWNKKRDSGGALYDTIAAFYRQNIIKPSLDHFSRKYFQPGSRLLHAGCGSGQVDKDLRGHFKVTAVDMSQPALNLYRKFNSPAGVVQGDIFSIPFTGEKFDGVYNLGVMEHFTEAEIKDALKEFDRVLKPGGRVLLFWPPEFGMSVIFLRIMHGILNTFSQRDVELHPPEITRVRSREHVRSLCEGNDLKMIDYYFGPRDMFTQSVIVLEKVK